MRSTILAATLVSAAIAANPVGQVQHGKQWKTITTYKDYDLGLNIKPKGPVNGWNNIIHFTGNNQNYGSDSSRIPGIWFFSNSYRMHVRQGRPGQANDGCDSCPALAYDQWNKVNVKLQGKTLTVAVNGNVCCTNTNYSSADPGRSDVRVYASDPWYAASNVQLKDFSYTNIDPAMVALQAKIKTYKRHLSSTAGSWRKCAREHASGAAGICACKGVIRYGAKNEYSFRQTTTQLECKNSIFGDPIHGTVKDCWCNDDAHVKAEALKLKQAKARAAAIKAAYAKQFKHYLKDKLEGDFNRKCAREHAQGNGGICVCHGVIRYGAKDKFSYKKSEGASKCNNQTFGDPIHGTVKDCWCNDHAHQMALKAKAAEQAKKEAAAKAEAAKKAAAAKKLAAIRAKEAAAKAKAAEKAKKEAAAKKAAEQAKIAAAKAEKAKQEAAAKAEDEKIAKEEAARAKKEQEEQEAREAAEAAAEEAARAKKEQEEQEAREAAEAAAEAAKLNILKSAAPVAPVAPVDPVAPCNTCDGATPNMTIEQKTVVNAAQTEAQ